MPISGPSIPAIFSEVRLIPALQAGKAILLGGIAFFCLLAATAAEPIDLALALFQEGDVRAAGREALRIELAHPENATARVVRAIAAVSLNGSDNNLATLTGIATNATLSADFRALAHYHHGVALLRTGRILEAVDPLRQAVLITRDPHIFVPCILALDKIGTASPAAIPPELLVQIKATRSLGSREMREEVASWFAPPSPGRPPAGARWVVGFYRSQINPAIGSRCAMHPSCSEYFRQASQKHGLLLGMAMGADRLCGEPDHARYRLNAINVGGLEKYADPVSEHDFWMDP